MKAPKVPGSFLMVAALALTLFTPVIGYATTVYQAAGSSYIAFEAESIASITNSSPTFWVITNEATANGGKAIYQAGVNQTASSSSFALYSLNFTQPGTYSVYYR